MLSKTKLNASFYWLIHPAALAFYVFLILLFSLPEYFNKYQLNVISLEIGNFSHKHYIDLNNNGAEELVTTGYNAGSIPMILLENHAGKTINQWNFKGKWIEDRLDLIDDYDHNQLKEIYCLTLKKDSILLHIVEPFNGDGVLVQNKFIDLAGVFNNDQVSVNFVDAKLIDTNADGFKEYVFILYAGFSKFPRKVYVYDIKNDHLISSPESAAGICRKAYFQDINNDGIDEISGRVAAHENIHYPMPYSDSSSWLMVFNLKGQVDFLFPPIEQKTGIGSEIVTIPYCFGEKSYYLSVFKSRSAEHVNDSIKLSVISLDGKILRNKSYHMENYSYLTFLETPKLQDNALYFHDQKGNIYRTDTSLLLKEHYLIDGQEQLMTHILRNYRLDIDQDNKDEYIIMTSTLNLGVLIYSSELKDPINVEIPSLNGSADWKIFTKTPTTKDPSNIVVNGTNRIAKLRYSKNPWYIWKYPLYLSSYIILFVLFWLLQKAQKSVVAKRYETEKQLMQQQMALSKKQMEPHFMLNMINNIGYLFSKGDQTNALFYLGKFGNLMRAGLLNSSKSQITLEEELEFVENYLILQKQLMDDDLVYQIMIEENIEDYAIQIPHSLIYTFVENAIKHGLIPKQGHRVLEIQVETDKGNHSISGQASLSKNENIKITIKDNGIGRQKSKELHTTDTGKGMEIIKTIIKGYNQLYGVKISYMVEDVLGEEGEVMGTLVVVWV